VLVFVWSQTLIFITLKLGGFIGRPGLLINFSEVSAIVFYFGLDFCGAWFQRVD